MPASSGTISSLSEGTFVAIETCTKKVEEVAEELESMRLGMAVRTVREGFVETLAYTEFPPERWRRIRMNNGTERINRETRMRTRLKYIVERGCSKWE